jgi:prevent-host-death family protein
MKKLNIREARAALSHLEEILEKEGEITITKRGRPIAVVRSLTGKRPMPSHKDLRRSMPRLERGSEELIREDRDSRG